MHYVNLRMPRSSTPLGLATAVDRYLVYLQTEENKSPLTIRNYRE